MQKQWYIKIWKEGKFIDFWSVIHLVDGMLMAGIAILIGLKYLVGLLIALVIILIWEFIEPPEKFTNKIFDVITSVSGFSLMYYAYTRSLFVWVAVLAISLNIWAWIIAKNYKKF